MGEVLVVIIVIQAAVSIIPALIAKSRGLNPWPYFAINFCGSFLLNYILVTIVVSVVAAMQKDLTPYAEDVSKKEFSPDEDGIDVNSKLRIPFYKIKHDNKTEKNALFFKAYNLSDETITGCRLRIKAFSKDNTAIFIGGQEAFDVEVSGLNILPRQVMQAMVCKPIELPDSAIGRVDLEVLEIQNGLNNVPNTPLVKHIKREELPKELVTAARKITSRAKYYCVDDPDYWLCTCGMVNHRDDTQCFDCKNEKELIVENFTKEKIECGL